MNLQELAESAVYHINYYKKLHPEMSPIMVLIVSGKQKKNQKHKYLSGRNSPKGEILATEKDQLTVMFDAWDILAYCLANGVEYSLIEKGKENENLCFTARSL